MNTQARNRPTLYLVTVLSIIVLTSLACSFTGIGLHTVSPVVEVTIDQAEFNREHGSLHIDFHSDGPCRNLLDKVTRVEFHDGYIRFIGTKHLSDGSAAEGSLDLSFGAENDVLQMKVIAVDIPNFDITNPCVVEFNQEAEQEMRQLVSDPEAQVLFKEVKVEEGVLRMKIQVNLDIEAR